MDVGSLSGFIIGITNTIFYLRPIRVTLFVYLLVGRMNVGLN